MSSLHGRIVAEIEADILSGALPPGARLPIEHDLATRYGCARMTVNKALVELTRRGLIERRKRAGTFVAPPRVHAMVLDVPDLAQGLAARGQAHGYRLLRRDAGAPRNAAERALAGDGEIMRLDGVHLADGLPLAVERRTVSLAAVPAIAAADFTAQAPGSWLLHHVPWTEAETRIAAEGADQVVAAQLAVAPGTACLVIERTTWRGPTGITFVRQHFLGTRYDLVARFGAEPK